MSEYTFYIQVDVLLKVDYQMKEPHFGGGKKISIF